MVVNYMETLEGDECGSSAKLAFLCFLNKGFFGKGFCSSGSSWRMCAEDRAHTDSLV